MTSEADELEELSAAEAAGGAIGDEELEIDLSEAVDLSPFAAKGLTVEVVATEVKTSAAGNRYIKARLSVIGGDYDRRTLWENINLKGKGASMGRLVLDALGAGIDWDAPRISPNKLIGLKATIDTRIESSEEYPDKTVVKNWKVYVAPAAAEASSLQ